MSIYQIHVNKSIHINAKNPKDQNKHNTYMFICIHVHMFHMRSICIVADPKALPWALAEDGHGVHGALEAREARACICKLLRSAFGEISFGGLYTCMHTHTYIHMYICIYRRACICICAGVCICMHIHKDIHIHMRIYPDDDDNDDDGDDEDDDGIHMVYCSTYTVTHTHMHTHVQHG